MSCTVQLGGWPTGNGQAVPVDHPPVGGYSDSGRDGEVPWISKSTRSHWSSRREEVLVRSVPHTEQTKSSLYSSPLQFLCLSDWWVECDSNAREWLQERHQHNFTMLFNSHLPALSSISGLILLAFCSHLDIVGTFPHKICLKSPWTVAWFSHIIYCLSDYCPEGRLMQCHR